MRRVGIEKIAVYCPPLALDLGALAARRGMDPEYPRRDLLARSRALNPLWEDPVTMAVNAARGMLAAEDMEKIELLIVGTESSPDQGKPLSTFVHRFLGLGAHCRNFEIKHACYGGTSALMMAAHWVASGAAPGAKALVICTDQSRDQLLEPSEYVMGAGAAALLVSDAPDVFEMDLSRHGYWTSEVADTFRPTSKKEAGNTELSVYCYLDALEGAFGHFVQKNGAFAFEERFRANAYHVPFCGMAQRAHRAVLSLHRGAKRREADRSFEEQVAPGLVYNSQVGCTYTASTFYSLCALVDSCSRLREGDEIGVFSYGSGSCAEFYGLRVGGRAAERIGAMKLASQFEGRSFVSVDQYEVLERMRADLVDRGTYEVERGGLSNLWADRYAGSGALVLKGLEGFFRTYEWS